ncbi:NnrS family protein [Pseudomarimonas salicorniae]|uniref:NnrS family protein n=1 Tax=Pseudomarimonas salicorniae TaxID=2933270 RepID=A0ABT0GDP0_9GAMM|nr:NnrS family protein [Lysobacter sp. CAU 1642]MCK7592668.1 NnrS family protein [Lysobacter sp. CAU 1642]
MATSTVSLPAWPITATPHRILFAVGALNLLLAMAWWAGWIGRLRWGLPGVPQDGLYGGSVHALVMPYLVLGPFLFGFLYTVFPRWMPVPAFSRRHYLPTAACLLAAQGLLLASAWQGGLVLAAALIGLVGWAGGAGLLLDRLRHDPTRCVHGLSIGLAMLVGLGGWSSFVLHALTGDPAWLQAATRVGVHGLLLPVYLSVAHRMFPFFAQCVVPGYQPWRPAAWLWLSVICSLAHLVLDISRLSDLLWLADLPLAALGIAWLWRCSPPAGSPFVLRALFLGMLWLPVGATLSGAQSLALYVGVDLVPLRAPLHAYTIGLFGALLVAMVSRVSRGHSGRPIRMNLVDRFAFFAIQMVALLRIGAEWTRDPWALNGVAAALWVLVLTPWLLQHLAYWSSPRADGKPG